MTLHLITISGSPRSWRVLLGLAFKGQKAQIHELKLSRNEHKSEPFLLLNPRGTVPVMQSDGLVLRDSMAILAWLDRKFPKRPLFGSTEQHAACIWQATMESRQYLRQAATDFLTPVFFQGASLADRGTPKWDMLQKAAVRVQSEMRFLDTRLSAGRTFLAGNTPSAADAVSWPEIRLVQRAAET